MTTGTVVVTYEAATSLRAASRAPLGHGGGRVRVCCDQIATRYSIALFLAKTSLKPRCGLAASSLASLRARCELAASSLASLRDLAARSGERRAKRSL